MSEDELKKLSEQYDQMTEKFQKEKDEYVDIFFIGEDEQFLELHRTILQPKQIGMNENVPSH